MIIDDILKDAKMSRYKLSKSAVFRRRQYQIFAAEEQKWRNVLQGRCINLQKL